MTSTAFIVDGGSPCTLADLLAANVDDDEVCAWAKTAIPGDTFPALVECCAILVDQEKT